MGWIAWKMLVGNRGKYLGLVVGIGFAALLITQQISIFCGLMRQTTSQIRDIRDAPLWIMDPSVQFVGDFRPLSESKLHRVRGVKGVEWAVPLYKGINRLRLLDGTSHEVILLGFDDATLTGAPRDLIRGEISALRQPDAVIVDDAGYQFLWPGEPFELGKTIELYDRRAVVVGICRASRTFRSYPILYTRYSQAIAFVPPERKLMSYVLAKAQPEFSDQDVCRKIAEQTGLRALPREQFCWKTMMWYLENTGIPANFAITVTLGVLVGSAVTAGMFYLFTMENLAHFGTLKAMGTGNGTLVGMILSQALVVGALGYGIGVGLATIFGESIKGHARLAFYMPWHVPFITAACILFMVVLASFWSIRRVLFLEPAIVFRNAAD